MVNTRVTITIFIKKLAEESHEWQNGKETYQTQWYFKEVIKAKVKQAD